MPSFAPAPDLASPLPPWSRHHAIARTPPGRRATWPAQRREGCRRGFGRATATSWDDSRGSCGRGRQRRGSGVSGPATHDPHATPPHPRQHLDGGARGPRPPYPSPGGSVAPSRDASRASGGGKIWGIGECEGWEKWSGEGRGQRVVVRAALDYANPRRRGFCGVFPAQNAENLSCYARRMHISVPC